MNTYPLPREGQSAHDLFNDLQIGRKSSFIYNGHLFDVENIPKPGVMKVVHRDTGAAWSYKHTSMLDYHGSAAILLDFINNQ